MKCTACKKPLTTRPIPWTECPAEKLCWDCRHHAYEQREFERLLEAYGIDPHEITATQLVERAAAEANKKSKPKAQVEHVVVSGEQIWGSWFGDKRAAKGA